MLPKSKSRYTLRSHDRISQLTPNKAIFGIEGKVIKSRLLANENGESLRTCFLTYKFQSQALAAVRTLHDSCVFGEPIIVDLMEPCPRKARIIEEEHVPAGETETTEPPMEFQYDEILETAVLAGKLA
jgi:hypothetical protein